VFIQHLNHYFVDLLQFCHRCLPPPPLTGIYAAAAAAIALKFHPKHEKRQNFRQNGTHYENITH
jgi:hypothetical protein